MSDATLSATVPSMLPFDVLLMTDRASCQRVRRSVLETLSLALQQSDARRVAVLLRDKQSPIAAVNAQVEQLQPVIQRAGALLLVHSYPAIANAWNLAGVHVTSQTQLKDTRDRLAPNMLLGASRHIDDPLDEGDLGLATYATISPIYAPTSKPGDRRPTLGLHGLRACAARSARPLVALGGMRPERVRTAIRAGAAAIAIGGAVMQAPNPAGVVRDCLQAIAAERRHANSIQ